MRHTVQDGRKLELTRAGGSEYSVDLVTSGAGRLRIGRVDQRTPRHQWRWVRPSGEVSELMFGTRADALESLAVQHDVPRAGLPA